MIVPVDYQLARRRGKSVMCTLPMSNTFLFTIVPFSFFLVLAAKQAALDVLNQVLEFDVARLLHHFDRFISHKAE